MNKKMMEGFIELELQKQQDFIEADTRGRIITMAVDIEFSLLAIIMYCAPNPYNQIREFKNMMMGQKIECAIADLKKYKNQYFERYKDELVKLDEFRKVRNDFAHHRLEFHEKGNLKTFRIVYIDLIDGKEQFHYRVYTTEYLSDYVKRCRDLNLELAKLVQELRDNFAATHLIP